MTRSTTKGRRVGLESTRPGPDTRDSVDGTWTLGPCTFTRCPRTTCASTRFGGRGCLDSRTGTRSMCQSNWCSFVCVSPALCVRMTTCRQIGACAHADRDLWAQVGTCMSEGYRSLLFGNFSSVRLLSGTVTGRGFGGWGRDDTDCPSDTLGPRRSPKSDAPRHSRGYRSLVEGRRVGNGAGVGVIEG